MGWAPRWLRGLLGGGKKAAETKPVKEKRRWGFGKSFREKAPAAARPPTPPVQPTATPRRGYAAAPDEADDEQSKRHRGGCGHCGGGRGRRRRGACGRRRGAADEQRAVRAGRRQAGGVGGCSDPGCFPWLPGEAGSEGAARAGEAAGAGPGQHRPAAGGGDAPVHARARPRPGARPRLPRNSLAVAVAQGHGSSGSADAGEVRSGRCPQARPFRLPEGELVEDAGQREAGQGEVGILREELAGPVGGGEVHGRREERQDSRGGQRQARAARFQEARRQPPPLAVLDENVRAEQPELRDHAGVAVQGLHDGAAVGAEPAVGGHGRGPEPAAPSRGHRRALRQPAVLLGDVAAGELAAGRLHADQERVLPQPLRGILRLPQLHGQHRVVPRQGALPERAQAEAAVREVQLPPQGVGGERLRDGALRALGRGGAEVGGVVPSRQVHQQGVPGLRQVGSAGHARQVLISDPILPKLLLDEVVFLLDQISVPKQGR